ncbi:MAG: hypothetical protein WC253_06920 [Sulfurovaceae bacterium]|nr:hypothetical protein [Sulfurovaceae bacterium]
MKYVDAPSAPYALSWKKEGYTQRMNEITLNQCGYSKFINYRKSKQANMDVYRQLKTQMEQCMLDMGFKYSATYWDELTNIDYPKKNRCNNEINMQYPGCISIKNEK